MNVVVPGELLDSMLTFARMQHPREAILLLRGSVNRDEIALEEHLFPPFASSGRGFAQFSPSMLPIDFSIVGTLHSHPSGSPRPSPTDLNHLYGRIMVIIAYPYTRDCVAVYDKRGERLPLEVSES
jgi:proteasome lid subunit RPN8/RPN11